MLLLTAVSLLWLGRFLRDGTRMLLLSICVTVCYVGLVPYVSLGVDLHSAGYCLDLWFAERFLPCVVCSRDLRREGLRRLASAAKV